MYEVVSTESVPSEPLVLTKPLPVKFESFERLMMFEPEKVLLSESKVVEATVTELPSATAEPLIVIEELAKLAFVMTPAFRSEVKAAAPESDSEVP